MASPQSSQHLASILEIEMWDHDPDATTAQVVTPDAGTTRRWYDMRDASHFMAAAMSSTLTGNGITKLEIVAADDTSGTNTIVIKDSGTVAADAVGDWVQQECSAEEIAQEGADNGSSPRYVAARITMANSADEAVVAYIAKGNRPHLDLTPATTIA